MKNMHIKYFMVLTVFILGLGDVPLHAAKKGSSSTPQKPAQSTQAPVAPQLSSQLKKDLTDTQNAIHDTKRELKGLLPELPNPNDRTAKYDPSKLHPKDLASSLSSVQKLLPLLIKLQKELPGAQKAGQMLTIKPVDLAKAIDTANDVVIKIKSVQKSLDKEKPKVRTQAYFTPYIGIYSVEYELIFAMAIITIAFFEITTTLESEIATALSAITTYLTDAGYKLPS